MAKCQFTGMCKLLTCGIILIPSRFWQSPYVCPVCLFIYMNTAYRTPHSLGYTKDLKMAKIGRNM